MKQNEKKLNIVQVHGAWANSSCWSPVTQRLQEDGYNVIAPQFPLTSLADNVLDLAKCWPSRRDNLVRSNAP